MNKSNNPINKFPKKIVNNYSVALLMHSQIAHIAEKNSIRI